MIRLMQRLFAPAPINGPAGYRRGYDNGSAFMGEGPDGDTQKRRWQQVSPPQDDYDRGYADAMQQLRAKKRDG